MTKELSSGITSMLTSSAAIVIGYVDIDKVLQRMGAILLIVSTCITIYLSLRAAKKKR
jgi:preprotein translocase subunit SecG